MIALSIVIAVCGLAASEAVGAYYQPIVSYGVAGPAAAGYLVPAYVPPYAAYHVAAPASGNAYYSGAQQDKQQAYDQPQDTKYYYGGKFQGTCSNDGLYYKDDSTFVICSNGYASEQPCPPGTKTGGYPSYQAGYYYGYTDLCSVNLVDYGYGPSSYASSASYADGKESSQAGYQQDKSYGYDDKSSYNSYGKESYSTVRSASAADSYSSNKPYQANGAYASAPSSYSQKGSYGASVPRDAAGYEIKEVYPASYPSANAYQSTAASYTTKNTYQQAGSSAYGARDSYQPSPAGSNPYVPKDTSYGASRDSAYPSGSASYQPKNDYQSKDSSYQGYPSKATASYPAKDAVYSPKDSYAKPTYSAKGPSDYPSLDKRYK